MFMLLICPVFIYCVTLEKCWLLNCWVNAVQCHCRKVFPSWIQSRKSPRIVEGWLSIFPFKGFKKEITYWAALGKLEGRTEHFRVVKLCFLVYCSEANCFCFISEPFYSPSSPTCSLSPALCSAAVKKNIRKYKGIRKVNPNSKSYNFGKKKKEKRKILWTLKLLQLRRPRTGWALLLGQLWSEGKAKWRQNNVLSFPFISLFMCFFLPPFMCFFLPPPLTPAKDPFFQQEFLHTFFGE